MNGFNRIITYKISYPALTSMFFYRSSGEIAYLSRLNEIIVAQMEAWRGREEVNMLAYCFMEEQFAWNFDSCKSRVCTGLRMSGMIGRVTIRTGVRYRINVFSNLTFMWRMFSERYRGCRTDSRVLRCREAVLRSYRRCSPTKGLN